MRKSLLEKIFSAPSEILNKGIEVGKDIERDLEEEKPVKAVREYWRILGPGLTTGAADDDPSGIATYSQAGASAGFGLIWLSVFTYPLMGAIQEMCARVGLATGLGLAANIKKHYSKKVLYLCALMLLFANVFNIGANLGAMAEGTRLIFPQLNFVFLVFSFAFLSLGFQIFVSYKNYSKYLKYLALVLFTYIFSTLSLDINWTQVLYAIFNPSFDFSKEQIILICAIMGTTISPYLFFWQTSQEVEEQILKGEKTEEDRRSKTTEIDIKNMRIDVWSGMFVSNLVMFFIIAACAATLYSNGILNINTAGDAALALRPFAGNFAYILFTLGILGTGFLSIPVLAGSASYAISESFGWKSGLSKDLKQAGAFYGVIILAMALGVILNLIGLNPIKTLIYSAVFNGLVSPIILFLIVRLASREDIMGKFKNKSAGRFFGWFTVVVMTLVSVTAIISLLL